MFFRSGFGCSSYFNGFSRYNTGWMIAGGILHLLLIGIVIFFTYKLISKLMSNNNPKSNHAIAILDEKFAMGEISEEDYKIRKKNLK